MTTDLDDLLPWIAAGDAEAFGAWIASAERPLRASLSSFATCVDIEAVVQEALLRAWQVAPRVARDGAPNALLRMTLRIARNLAIDEARRVRSVEIDEAEPEAAPDLGAALPDPLLRDAIQHCTEQLPAKPKQALLARITSRGNERDSALALAIGMQLNTFLQNVTRARKLLADCLRGRGIDLGGLT